MIELSVALETRNSICLWALEELGFGHAVRCCSLETVVEAAVGIVEVLDARDISALVVTGGIPTADVYATYAWAEWRPGTVGHHVAALAIVAHLSELIA